MIHWNPKMPIKTSPFLPKVLLQVLLLATISLAGCSYFQFPGVHRVEVQQGNIVTQDMVDQLRLGMTKSQVRYIMGTPIIADTFSQDRWDYYYSRKKGSKMKEQYDVTIFFIDGKVSRIDNNFNAGKDDKSED